MKRSAALGGGHFWCKQNPDVQTEANPDVRSDERGGCEEEEEEEGWPPNEEQLFVPSSFSDIRNLC